VTTPASLTWTEVTARRMDRHALTAPATNLGPADIAGVLCGAHAQAGNYPVLLIDGVVGGVWHQRRSGGKVAITVEPLRELSTTQRRQLDDDVELVGTVVEATPTLTLGTVTVGPHA